MGPSVCCRTFCEELTDKVFYNTFGKENNEKNRAKELGADYASMFFNDSGQNTAPMDEEAEPKGPPAQTPEKLRESRAYGRDEDDQDGDEESIAIHGIVMGELENNYLMRGNKFEVLRNVMGGGVEDKGVSFTLTTPQDKGGMRGSCTPSRALLAQGERHMHLLTPDNRNQLLQADIETGKIISTWTFNKDGVDIPMNDINHDTKSGAAEERSTFLGLDNNRLCRWDLRDARGVVQESPLVNYEPGGKDYSRGTNFTCMATSGDGYVAVGSKDGKVRLYSNKSLSKAQTAIPGLGAPITAIDVTYDGKWVVATTDHYLMVVKTTFTSDKGDTFNSFTSCTGSRGARLPSLLRLKPLACYSPTHMCTCGKAFQKGKFTWITEAGNSERWIATSCGSHSVVWNFAKLKSSSAGSLSFGGLPTCMDYVLKANNAEVVDSAFVHQRYAATPSRKSMLGDIESMVVATPHSLFNIGGH
eukprot:gene24531-10138_t